MAEFDQRQYVQLKSSLTRAVNRGEPGKIIDECIRAHMCFQATGYPDDWTRWMNALQEAIQKANRIAMDF